MNRGIYAVQDTLAKEFVGGVHLFGADAPAIRWFSDIASQPDTVVARHLGDHQLVRLATVP